ncbi:MAG TPA: hypothetical protein VFA98_12430 [Thermoanaerobaculia bacterium]|nr:hypothetical protein [Thermoanaerobaculia bacterium]
MKRRRIATKKSKARKPAGRKRATPAAKRRARRTAAKRRPAAKARGRKPAAKKRLAGAPEKPVRRKRSPKTTARRAATARASVERPRARLVQGWQRGLGGEAAGQSGDLEAIPRREDVDSESVEELLEEGQSWEAGIVSGVENADDETGEVRTREVPEDDVPEEYRDDED